MTTKPSNNKTSWKILETCNIPPNTHLLPRSDRADIYKKLTMTYASLENIPAGSLGTVFPMNLASQVKAITFYIYILGIPLFTMPVLLCCFYFLIETRDYRPLAATLMILTILSIHPIKVGKDGIKGWIESKMLVDLYTYSSFKIVYPTSCERDVDLPAIGSGGPHGVFPIGALLSLPAMNEFLNINFRGGIASVVSLTPGLRSVMGLGAIDVGKKSVLRAILERKETVGIVADGINGIFVSATVKGDFEAFAILDKKGICKLALQQGLRIEISYWFGNANVLDAAVDPLGFMKWLSRKLKISLFLFYGRWFLPVPTREPIVMAVGEAVRVEKKVDNPTQEQIDELHSRVMAAHKNLFDGLKVAYGGKDWTAKELLICS